jgi:sugar lactone lactonase YvrE
MKIARLIFWVLTPELILGLTLSMNCLFAQGTWKYYTVDDGLAHNNVGCIRQDMLGNMWFGTARGLSKMDTNGVWTTYLTEYVIKQSDEVLVGDIVIDRQNRTWLIVCGTFNDASDNRVAVFNDSVFTFYDPAAGVSSNQKPISVGIDSSGAIWAGMMDNYAWRFDGIQWEPHYVWGTWIYDAVNDIVTDRNGKLFFIHDAGITTWEDGYLWVGVDGSLEMLHVAFDRQNRMWCASRGKGLRMLEFEPFQWTFYFEADGLLFDQTMTVAVDSNNLVWIGFPDGAQRFDGKNWLTFTDENGLIYNQVWDIFVKPNGDIWFATGGGISVFHDTTSTTHVKPSKVTELPAEFKFYLNYPNPFNSATRIGYSLEEPQNVKLGIYNVNAQLIKELVNEFQPTGTYEIVWNARDNSGKEVSSGVYFGVLQVGAEQASRKMLRIR